jgi:hypothetical protein
MRFLIFVFTIGTFIFTKGQNVFTNFKDTLCLENFNDNSSKKFPQKFNSLELSIIENGNYRINRIETTGRSIAYLQQNNNINSFELKTSVKFSKSSNLSSGGIIFHSQSNPNRALFFEINNERKFRVTKLFNQQSKLLNGEPKSLGWIKNTSIEKSGINTLTIRTNMGYSDFFINGNYIHSIYDVQLQEGRIGLFAGAESEILINDFLLKSNIKKENVVGISTDNQKNKDEPNVEFQEVILIFKAKIDKQQTTILSLQREVDKYRGMLNYDTTLVSRASFLESENKALTFKLDSTTQALDKNQSRLAYLESIKEDVEKGSNGDLVLNLTSILAELKKENNSLKSDEVAYRNKNTQLKEDNKILLREIDRLKSLIEPKN